MSRIIPLGSIPSTTILPDGIFRLRVKKLEAVLTKEREGKVQKYMLRMLSEVVEPTNLKGLTYFENFVIGTDDDADAELLETWQTSIGGRQFKRFTDKAGVPLADEVSEESLCSSLNGAEYLATIVQKVDDGKKDERFKGRVSNNTSAYWSLGEKEPALTNGQAGRPGVAASTTATRAGAQAAKRTATPDAKPAPTDEVTCSACRKRVPKTQLKDHVDAHMRELAQAGGQEAEAE